MVQPCKKKLRIGLVVGSEPPIQTATECATVAVRAEKDGFDSVWIPDHLCDIDGTVADPWTALAYIAAKTEKIRLYTAVTDFQKIHPAKLAQMVATLDELSDGRITLGIGTGEVMNIVPYGIEWDEPSVRVKKLDEYIKVMRLLWKSRLDDPLSFQGNYYSLRNAWIDQKPVQKPYPPICIGALGSKRMLNLIGRVGDGWFPVGITSDLYREKLNMIYRAAKKANRNPESIEATSLIFVVATSDPEVIAKSTKTLRAYIATTSRNVLKAKGVRLPTTEMETNYQKMIISRDTLNEVSKLAEAVPTSIVREVSAVGTVDEVIAFLEDRISSGATHLVINPSQGILEQNLKALKEEIIPHLKERHA